MEDEAGAPLPGCCRFPLGEEGGFRQPESQVLKAIFVLCKIVRKREIISCRGQGKGGIKRGGQKHGMES